MNIKIALFLIFFSFFVFSKNFSYAYTIVKANDTSTEVYKGQVNTSNPPTSLTFGTELTAEDYLEIGASDNTYDSQATSSNQYATFRFNYSLPVYSSLNYANVSVEHKSGLSAYNMYFYLWNFTSSAWVLKTNITSSSDVFSNYSVNGGEINDFVSNNYLHVLLELPVSGTTTLYVDYSDVTVDYEPRDVLEIKSNIDTYVDSANPVDSYDGLTYGYVSNGSTVYRTYAKFNLTNYNIASASYYNVSLVSNDAYDSSATVCIHHVNNTGSSNWTGMTWYNQICGNTVHTFNSNCNSTAIQCWTKDWELGISGEIYTDFDVTGTVKNLYNSTDNQTAFVFTMDLPSEGDTNDYVKWKFNGTYIFIRTDALSYDYNSVPTSGTPTIYPTTAYTNSDLNCEVTITDSDADTLTAYYKWYVNDTSNVSGTYTPISNGTATNVSSILFGNTSLGDTWTCEITPFDGFENGTSINSTGKEISNSLPSVTSVGISPPVAYINTYILGNTTIYDLDCQTITSYYFWYKNNALNTTGYNSSAISNNTNTIINVLPNTYIVKDDEWIFGIIPYDSIANGTQINSSSLTISNSAPTSENAIEPTDPSIYTPIANYTFNFTVDDNDLVADLSTVLFEFNSSCASTLANTTVTSYSNYNTTARNYTINKSDLCAGIYSWKWYANDSSNVWANTQSGTYNISRGTPNITLTVTPTTPITYGTGSNATCTVDVTQGGCSLFRANVNVSSTENNTNFYLPAATHTYVCNYTQTENYTTDTDSSNYVVNKAIPILTLNNGTTTINTSELLLYIKFEVNSTSINFYDSSGHNNNITLSRPENSSYNTGIFEKAIHIYGVNGVVGKSGFMSADYFPATNLTSDSFSVVFWVNTSSFFGANTFYIAIRDSMSACSFRSISIEENSGNTTFTVCNGTTQTIYSSSNISLNTWHQLAAVFDNSTTTMSLYKDGILQSSKKIYIYNKTNRNNFLRIGTLDTGQEINATYDNIMIWNRSLSADEIQLLYQTTNTYNTSTNTFTGTESNVNDSTSTYNFYRNVSDVKTAENGTATTLGAGFHYYIFNTTGGENYTQASLLIPLNISQGIPNVRTYIDNGALNKTITYLTSATIVGNSTTTLTPPTFNLYLNSFTTSGNPSTLTNTYGASTYNVIYNTSGNSNWTSASNSSLYLTINKNIPNLTMSNNSATINTTGLVVYWKMENVNSSNYTLDSSGYGNDGLLTNFNATSTGKFGNGLLFDGLNDYVDVTPNFGTDNTTLSWVFWIKRNSTNAGYIHRNYSPLIYRGSSGVQVYWGGSTGMPVGAGKYTNNYYMSENEWNFVAFVSNSTYYWLYLNATLLENNSFVPGTVGTNNIDFGYYSTNFLNGSLDEVMIWNRTLTASEIYLLYKSRISNSTASNFNGSESNTGDDDLTYSFFRNDSSASNPDTSTRSSGLHYYIYNTSGGTNYTLSNLLLPLSTNWLPTITPQTPTNNDHTNLNGSAGKALNFTFDYSDTDSDAGTCSVFNYSGVCWGTVANVASGTTGQNITLNTTLVDGSYIWYVNCSDSFDTTQSSNMTLVIDTIYPDWTINSINVANTTSYNQNWHNLTINDSCSDNNLYKCLINVTNTSHIVNSNETGALSSTSYAYNHQVYLGNLSDGTYTIEYSASDDHTFGSIDDLRNILSNEKIIFYDGKTTYEMLMGIYEDHAGFIEVPSKISNVSTRKYEDKYKWSWQFFGTKTAVKIVGSNVVYRTPVSGIPGHFIIDNKYYVDFSDAANMYKINVIEENKSYVVILEPINIGKAAKNYFVDPVTGGLNTQTEYYSFLLDSVQPIINSWSLNDTYINFNETVNLQVNITETNVSTVLVTLQKPSSNSNYSLIYDVSSGNYTRLLNKTDLGDTQSNDGIINITYIYVNDTSGNNASTTTTMQFYYAQTTGSTTVIPTSVYNSAGDYITVYTFYNETLTGNPISDNCTITIGATEYVSSYNSGAGKYSKAISVNGWTSSPYYGTVSCENSSYQSNETSFNFTVFGTGSPGGGGGGGGGSSTVVNASIICGDGYCAPIENSLTCPEDCEREFSYDPPEFIQPAIRGDSIIRYIMINNPNENVLHVNTKIICGEDYSCSWAFLENNVEMKEKNVIISNGTEELMSSEKVRITVEVPENAEFKDYDFSILLSTNITSATIPYTIEVRKPISGLYYVFKTIVKWLGDTIDKFDITLKKPVGNISKFNIIDLTLKTVSVGFSIGLIYKFGLYLYSEQKKKRKK